MDPAMFERERLALFASLGFDGESRWAEDREGRHTYMIGRGEGPNPTVLVHGGLSEASEWFLLAEHIPGHVIIPDRPGCGLSYQIDYRGVDYRQAAADWLLDLVGSDANQVDIIANSMGGFFSMAFATAHPERVRRLVLVGAPAGLDAELPLFIRLMANPIIGPVIRRMKIKDPEVLRSRVFSNLVAHPERVPVEFLKMAIAAAALPGAATASSTMLRAVSTWRGWRQHLLMREDMARLPVSTLFIWGESDTFAPPASGKELAARMPDAKFTLLADAGHVPYLEQPNAVATAVNKFLAS